MNFKLKAVCLFLALFLICFTASCGIADEAASRYIKFREKETEEQSEDGTDKTEENYEPVINTNETETEKDKSGEDAANPPILEVNPKFDEYLKINSDIVGYIKIENTIIDFPVVYNGNNDYYLKHDIYGNPTKYGAIFMDETNKGAVLARNTIIHGHNFEGNDNNMFADLEKYKKQEFFENNKIIKFDNLYSDMEWEVFAVYYTKEEDYYLLSSFSSDKEYSDFVDLIKSRAMFWSDYKPRKGDYMLTLHTCSYEVMNAHTMVHARLVKKTDNYIN